MNSNVELLKRNLKNWLNKNNNESEDLKKKIIDALNYFKSFLNNDLVLMLNDLSKTYDFKNNKERIEIYSNDSDSLKEQNYLVLITNEPRINFLLKIQQINILRLIADLLNIIYALKIQIAIVQAIY